MPVSRWIPVGLSIGLNGLWCDGLKNSVWISSMSSSMHVSVKSANSPSS